MKTVILCVCVIFLTCCFTVLLSCILPRLLLLLFLAYDEGWEEVFQSFGRPCHVVIVSHWARGFSSHRTKAGRPRVFFQIRKQEERQQKNEKKSQGGDDKEGKKKPQETISS